MDARFAQVNHRFDRVEGDIGELRRETSQQCAALARRFDLLVVALLTASLAGLVSILAS